MMKINKHFISKVIVLVVIAAFSLTTAAHSIDLSKNAHLRIPLLFNLNVRGSNEEKGTRREPAMRLDLNQKGLLVTGRRDIDNPDDIMKDLDDIMDNGLLPGSSTGKGSSVFPDKVSLSMVGEKGLRANTPSVWDFPLILVIDSDYVQRSTQQFEAVGSHLQSRHHFYRDYALEKGGLPYGLRQNEKNLAEADEVHVDNVLPEGILALVVKTAYRDVQKVINWAQKRYETGRYVVGIYDEAGDVLWSPDTHRREDIVLQADEPGIVKRVLEKLITLRQKLSHIGLRNNL